MNKYELPIGDALTILKTMQDQYVNCWVTSPPYWGLRDYGVEGQLGLEKTPEEYVAKMVEIFREARRVLRDDGTLWLNLGDTYARDGQKGDNSGYGKHADYLNGEPYPLHDRNIPGGMKAKDLVGIPWMVAFALRADGWYFRSACPWIKRNCMPESCKDRPTNAIEYVFLFSKSEKYFYDHEAVKLPASPDTHARYARGRSNDHKWVDGGPGDQTIAKSFEHMRNPGVTPKSQPAGSGIKANDSFQAACKDIVDARARRNSDWFFDSLQGMLTDDFGDPLAFIINSKGFPQAHFATFPPKLVEPCILAGCPEGGIVGDMFAGSGTTGKEALRLFRRFWGCELNPTYANEIAIPRIEAEAIRYKQAVMF